MPSADVTIRSEATSDDLIDVLEGNRAYIPCLYVLNKVDEITLEELNVLNKVPHSVFVSADKEWNLQGLLRRVWEYLSLIRIYTKPRGLPPDYNEPVVLPKKRC